MRWRAKTTPSVIKAWELSASIKIRRHLADSPLAADIPELPWPTLRLDKESIFSSNAKISQFIAGYLQYLHSLWNGTFIIPRRKERTAQLKNHFRHTCNAKAAEYLLLRRENRQKSGRKGEMGFGRVCVDFDHLLLRNIHSRQIYFLNCSKPSEEHSILSDPNHQLFCYGKTLSFCVWNIAFSFQIWKSRKHLKSRANDKISIVTGKREAVKRKTAVKQGW